MGFITKPDFSNNRQIKQFKETLTQLSGTTIFGIDDVLIPMNLSADTINIDALQNIRTRGVILPRELENYTGSSYQILGRNGDTGKVVGVEIGEVGKLGALDEGNGIGYRIIGRDPANYGNIGLNAVDLSFSDFPSTTKGATGKNSHTEGTSTTASGFESHAEGRDTTASGDQSHAQNGFNVASGEFSHAEGLFNYARSQAEHSGGAYGSDYTPTNTDTDRIVNYGNGTSNTARSDAFTIYKNGAVRFFRATLSSITNAVKEGMLIYDSGNANRPTIHNGTVWKPLAYVDELTSSGITYTTSVISSSGDTIIRLSGSDSSTDDITLIGGTNTTLDVTGDTITFNSLAGSLEAIDEGNGIGYRLRGKDPSQHENIGKGSIDLLTIYDANLVSGASGEASFAAGADNLSSGFFAVTFGYLNKAIANYSVAFGYNNEVSGENAIAFGRDNVSSGHNTVVFGQGNTITKEFALSAGNQNINTGEGSTTIGVRCIARAAGEAVLGSNSLDITAVNATQIDGRDLAFHVGASANQNARRSQLMVFKSGFIKLTPINITNTTINPNVPNGVEGGFGLDNQNANRPTIHNGTAWKALAYVDDISSSGITYTTSVISSSGDTIIRLSGSDSSTDDITLIGGDNITLNTSGDTITFNTLADISSGLEALNEGNGIGYRIIGRDPIDYGNIGLNAVDLSYSTVTGTTNGATGNYSHAQGMDTIASGEASHAEGSETNASGNYSHSEGFRTGASGRNSHAEGTLTSASGINSHAEGSTTNASGNISHAEGYTTNASGVASHAEGRGSFARSYAEHSGGLFGTDYTPISITGFTAEDRLLNYGNGVDNNNRRDAFTIYKNGAVRFFRSELSGITNTVKEGMLIYDSGNNNRPTIHNGTEWKGLAYNHDNLIFVSSKSDFPTPVSGVTTLADNVTYFIAANVDLEGDRLVGGQNTTIIGGSSETSKITSTGLDVNTALFTTQYTTPIRHISFNDVGKALDIDGQTTSALDWTGVNFVNVPNIGVVQNADNFIFTKGAFLNSKGLRFTGTIGTIAISDSLLSGDGTAGSIVEVDSLAVVTRRFRIIYSSIIAFGSTVGLDVSTSANILNQGYILDTVNFGGGGNYITGVQADDNKALFSNTNGIKNSADISQYYMNGNTTATTISAVATEYKVAGATTSAPLTQKFVNTNNRATYVGALTKYFKVTATLSITSGNNNQVGVYIYKDGIKIIGSEIYTTTDAGGRAEAITVQALVGLKENEYIEIWVENNTSTSNITVTELNVIIT